MDQLSKRWSVLILIALCGVIVFSRLHTYREPLDRDLTSYAVIGHEMLAGKSLYRELWDHKPPAIHVTYAAAELVAGYGRGSIFLLNILAGIVTMLVCYRAGFAAGGGRIAGCFAAGFWTFTSGNLALEGNQPNTEVFINAFLAAAFTMFVNTEKKNLGSRGALVVGVLFAMASLYKQLVVIVAFFLAVAYLVSCETGLRKRAFKDVLIIGGTGLAVWLLVFIYFFARGSGAAFVEAVFGYNRYYSTNVSHQVLNDFRRWMVFTPDILAVGLPLAMLTLAGTVRGVFFAPQQRWILLFVYIISSEIAVLLPQWPFPHYYQLLLPPLAIGAAWSIELFQGVLPDNRRSLPRMIGAAICGVIVATQLPNYLLPAEDWSTKKYGSIFLQTEKLASKLDALLSPNETFYEWGNETGLYFESGRRPPSGITFAYPLLGGPLKAKLSARLIEDLNRTQPQLIVADVSTMALTERAHPVLTWLKENYNTFARTDEFFLLGRKGGRLDPHSASAARPEAAVVGR